MGGVSTARSTPRERTVRSTGVPSGADADALRRHPARRPRGPRPGSTSGPRPRRGDRRRRLDHQGTRRAPTVARARPPPGAVTSSRVPVAAARSTTPSAQPAARRARLVGGPDHLDLLDRPRRRSGPRPARRASTTPACGRHPHRRPGRVAGSTPAARGGRLGPRRTVSSRVHSTRTGRPARRPAVGPRPATGEATLPPKAPPLASGLAGSPPGRTTRRRARGRRARPTSSAGCRASRPRARPRGGAGPRCCAGPGPCPAAARASARVSPTAQPPWPSGTATRASAGASSSAKPPRPRATSGADPLGPPPSSWARSRRGGQVATGHAVHAARRCAARVQASRMVRQPVQRHRWASSACSTAGRSAGAVPRRAGPRGAR